MVKGKMAVGSYISAMADGMTNLFLFSGVIGAFVTGFGKWEEEQWVVMG